VTATVQKRPGDCTDEELNAFEGLVKKGGEVAASGLRSRIKSAQWLVFLFEENQSLAGVAALKRPSGTYKKKVFRKAKSREDPDDFRFEAGWIYIDDQFRRKGHSRVLLDAVLKLAGEGQVYATTREDNEPMRRTNRRCGLQESGSPYRSDEGEYKLVLYLRKSAH